MEEKNEIRLCRQYALYDSKASGEISALRRLLGNRAKDIQHIGSTAIRGILSLPIMDLCVSVTDERDRIEVVRILSRHGFHKAPLFDTDAIRMVRKQRDRTLASQAVFIVRENSSAHRDFLLFRNYLNGHVFAANEYEELKQALIKKHPHDPEKYAAGKSGFIKNILRLSATDPLLGRRLTIVVDHPLGSTDNEDPSLQYALNLGFVPGIPAPNGEKLRAYIYGVKNPVHRFTGTVIAVVHRKDGDDDVLVVAPSGVVTYEPMIEQAVAFLENRYNTSIVCIYEKSCGGILYRRRADGVFEYLVLHQHRGGTWSVPKGHIATGESERETALREIREETGLTVSLLDGFRKELSYTVSAKASKNLVLFLAEATGELALGENEISEAVWVEKSAAIRRLGGRSIGHIIEAAEVFLNERFPLQG